MAAKRIKTPIFRLLVVIISMTLIGMPFLASGAVGQQVLADTGERISNGASPDDSLASALYGDGKVGDEPYFYEAMQRWRQEQIPYGTSEIPIDLFAYAAQSPDRVVSEGSYQGEDRVLLWSKPRGWIEYEVNVEQEGLYAMAAEYFPYTDSDGGSRQPVMVSVQVNGAFPYRESRTISLDREYEQGPEKFDASGNQLRSPLREISTWRMKSFEDSEGAYASPLVWHLLQGRNTIRIEISRQPVALKSLRLQPAAPLPTYEVARKNAHAVATSRQAYTKIEAESFSSKNSSSIQTLYDRDPLTYPGSPDRIRFNTLGGATWSKGRQAVTWDFDVPEDGMYKIAFRAKQSMRKNAAVFRTIFIDGQIPFQEMSNYKFSYASGWHAVTLEDGKGEPYAFYLAEGKHSITLEAGYEPYIPIIADIDRMSRELRNVSQEIRSATGIQEDRWNGADSYRVWDVDKDMPGVAERLKALQRQFAQLSVRMLDINEETDSVAQMFKTSAKDVEQLLARPDEIPYSQLTLGTLQEKLESQRSELTNSPLQLDTIYIAPLAAELPKMKANVLEKLWGALTTLYYSFTAPESLQGNRDEELNVWMIKGRDYVDELQQLADEKFTPEYGIRVKVNLIQSADMLILGKAAGILPDLAIGVASGSVFDLALRHALYDLAALPDAGRLIDKFHPGVMLPYLYDGGVYGIPETFNFKVLFYRQDLLRQLGLQVPDTWDDVYAMLPTLLQNDKNFYVDPADYSYLFFQNGVELYTPDGMSSALREPQAFEAFKKWTDLFNIYGLERQVASFYNQFRDGTLPIGIADFSQYMQLLIAAPEIRNEWAIAPIPGVRQADGNIARWSGGTGTTPTSCVLFKDTKPRNREQAWKFLQWYMSDDVQTEYGLNLEQYRGETFRWNSANQAAFAAMPWREKDLQAIMEQWRWTKDVPNVPGGYITAREIGFAWNRAVIDGDNPRETLEKSVKVIERELKRKQQEFHYTDEQGNVMRTLTIPRVAEPWEGVKPDGS